MREALDRKGDGGRERERERGKKPVGGERETETERAREKVGREGVGEI